MNSIWFYVLWRKYLVKLASSNAQYFREKDCYALLNFWMNWANPDALLLISVCVYQQASWTSSHFAELVLVRCAAWLSLWEVFALIFSLLSSIRFPPCSIFEEIQNLNHFLWAMTVECESWVLVWSFRSWSVCVVSESVQRPEHPAPSSPWPPLSRPRWTSGRIAWDWPAAWRWWCQGGASGSASVRHTVCASSVTSQSGDPCRWSTPPLTKIGNGITNTYRV